MGKTILTPKQLAFLERLQSEKQLTRKFYWTGGTALSEFYLHHRLSEDIDLFTEHEEVNQLLIHAFLKKIGPSLSVRTIKESHFLGLYSYTLVYKDKQTLKVDFNYYPFSRIETGPKYNSISVDSLHDIAANKLHTLCMRPRPRDYIDLYFIMKKQDFPLKALLIDAKTKFDWHLDPITLASQFVRVKEVPEGNMPHMLIKFDKQDMENFFLKLAKNLGKDIFS